MPSLTKHTIHVTILDDSRQKECDADCGVDWSAGEAIALASQRIEERFGDKIRLAYLDLSTAATNRDAAEWHEVVKNQNLPLPLLVINGQPRISGQFDTRRLLDAIDAEIEIGA
jgi:hypothetical protein